MASISTDAGGKRRILVVAPDGSMRHYRMVTETDFRKAADQTHAADDSTQNRRSKRRAILENPGKKRHKPLQFKGLCYSPQWLPRAHQNH